MYEKIKKPQETIELTDEQLKDVAGGADGDTEMLRCFKCNQKVQHEFRDEAWYCTVCGEKYNDYADLLRPIDVSR